MSPRFAGVRRIFSSLQIPNYRLYFTGQMFSLSGMWMQFIAMSWLVLELTGSGTALGVVSALQFLPVLLLGPMGGVIADRLNKRKILYVTQMLMATQSILLGVLVVTGLIEVWMIYTLAVMFGLVLVVDNPARQSFIHEIVGQEHLTNAVSLNSVVVNMARIIGPGFAGVLIVSVGMAPCFFIAGATRIAPTAMLLAMNAARLMPGPRAGRSKGQVRDGLRYVARTPEVLVPLILMAVAGTLAYSFNVVLPLIARFTFDGDASTFATMTMLMGAGAIVGGLATAAGGRKPATTLARTAVLFGGIQLVTSMAPTLPMMFIGLVFLGAASIRFLALSNATLQLAADPAMRGRVMALWAVAFLGSTPIGGPIVGWIGEHVGPRFAMGLGGVATLLCGLFAYPALKRIVARADAIELPDPEGTA